MPISQAGTFPSATMRERSRQASRNVTEVRSSASAQSAVWRKRNPKTRRAWRSNSSANASLSPRDVRRQSASSEISPITS
jgi:hypothetical protein